LVQVKKAEEKATENLVQARQAEQKTAESLVQVKKAEEKATENLVQARQAEQEAIRNLIQANYNLAKVFEEKAGNALDKGLESKNPHDFQQTWLYTLAALQQDIGGRNLPVSQGRLVQSELRSGKNTGFRLLG